MAFQGLEAKRDALKHRCPAAAYGLECQGRERCSEAAGVAPDGFGRTLRVRLRRSGGRILTPLPRSSPTWARRYAERSALERINARLDDGFRFERHAVRGKDRMAAKVGLALAVMMALALGSVKANAHGRSLIRPPPAQAARAFAARASRGPPRGCARPRPAKTPKTQCPAPQKRPRTALVRREHELPPL